MVHALNQLLNPVRRRIENLISRAVLAAVDDTKKLQLLQVTVLDSETRDFVERFQEYGFTSVPLPGAEAVLLSVGGHRDHLLVIGVDDRSLRKTSLQPGEAAMYNHQGAYLLVKTGPALEANAPLNLVNGAVYKVAGNQVVGPRGAAVADSTPTAASVSAQLNAALARLRDHGLIAP